MGGCSGPTLRTEAEIMIVVETAGEAAFTAAEGAYREALSRWRAAKRAYAAGEMERSSFLAVQRWFEDVLSEWERAEDALNLSHGTTMHVP